MLVVTEFRSWFLSVIKKGCTESILVFSTLLVTKSILKSCFLCPLDHPTPTDTNVGFLSYIILMWRRHSIILIYLYKHCPNYEILNRQTSWCSVVIPFKVLFASFLHMTDFTFANRLSSFISCYIRYWYELKIKGFLSSIGKIKLGISFYFPLLLSISTMFIL